MLTKLSISKLRGIREGELQGLRPLTILLGPNGCGKSTVLEAAGIASAGCSASAAFRTLATREWLGIAGMAYWFDKDDGATTVATFEPPPKWHPPGAPANTSNGVAIDSLRCNLRPGPLDSPLLQAARDNSESGELSALTATLFLQGVARQRPGMNLDPVLQGTAVINEDGHVVKREEPAWYNRAFTIHGNFADIQAGSRKRMSAPRSSSALRMALARMKVTPWYDDFVSYLRDLRPKLDTIESIAVGDRDEPFVFERDPRVGYPIAYGGDGLRRSLLLASSLAEARNGIAALDEPEAYEHPAMFVGLARLFRHALSDGTQIIIATHSLEFVQAVLSELTDKTDETAVIGLMLTAGKLSQTVISGEDAHRRVVELGDDLRL